MENQNFKDANIPHWGGGNSFECALSKGGSPKCVQNACRGREGVKKGQKTACALYVWPLICIFFWTSCQYLFFRLNMYD